MKHNSEQTESPVVCNNFLADMGYDDPDEMRLKFYIVGKISEIIDAKKMRQKDVEKITGIPQSDVSKIVNGRVKSYSVWKLLKMALSLGKNIHVHFQDTEKECGTIFAD